MESYGLDVQEIFDEKGKHRFSIFVVVKDDGKELKFCPEKNFEIESDKVWRDERSAPWWTSRLTAQELWDEFDKWKEDFQVKKD